MTPLLLHSLSILLTLLITHLQHTHAQTTNITGATTISSAAKSLNHTTFYASHNDESALLIQDTGHLTCTHSQIIKTGNTTNKDDSNFSALNAAIAVQRNGTLSLSHSFIYTSGYFATAIKVYESGSSAYLSDVAIAASGSMSHGVYMAGGYMHLSDVSVTVDANYAGCYSTDKGGGVMEIYHSSCFTLQDHAVIVYSTGDITATSLTGTTLQSPAGTIDGANNSITLLNPTFTIAPTTWGVFQIFNSANTTNASAPGTATLHISGGTISETRGLCPFLFTANANSEIHLSNNIDISIPSGIFLNASADYEWGVEGENGGIASVTLRNQSVKGDVYVDDISIARVRLEDGGEFVGAVNGGDRRGRVEVRVGRGGVWNVTGMSFLDVLEVEGDGDGEGEGVEEGIEGLFSKGFTVYYNGVANEWLNNRTITLDGGGVLRPT
ncbi:MAG: hypothetical protein M1834_003332 [Cirrosporium novae-zelandiae]|nr:MAG: hypothetical protein M1834_003332 [Cirrosporium novae-zelandiae]